MLGICFGEGTEGLPGQGGSGPGVPLGGPAILLAVTGPEHALAHIPARPSQAPFIAQYHYQDWMGWGEVWSRGEVVAGQDRTGQGRAVQCRAGQGRAGQGRAGQRRLLFNTGQLPASISCTTTKLSVAV